MGKQKNFYDKVLERLLKDTVITDSRITFPFANFKQPELSSDSLLSVSIWMDGRWENHKYPHRFEKYVNDIYGLTYEESVILWNSYMDIIEKEVLKRLRRNKSNVATTWGMTRHNINESGDKQKKFLDKVLEHIVNRTKVDYDKGEITFPFDADINPFGLSSLRSNFLYSPYFSLPFVKYCINTFGLTEDEIEYVYHRYVKIIKDKHNK